MEEIYNYRLAIRIDGNHHAFMQFKTLDLLHLVERVSQHKLVGQKAEFIPEKYDDVSKSWFPRWSWDFKSGAWNMID